MFKILNDPAATSNKATHTAQARPDKVDIDILVAGIAGTGVVGDGCAVTPYSAGSLNVNVAAGTVFIEGVRVAVAGQTNLTVAAADGAQPRRDLVVIDTTGTASVVTGTAGATPDLPDVPASSVTVAALDVAARITAVTTNDITDKRVPFTGQQGGTVGAPAGTTIWSVQPVDATKAPFQCHLGGGVFETVWDYVLRMGYNAGDSTIVTGEPVAEWVVEASYQIGAKRYLECYWQYIDENGNNSRPLSFGPIPTDGSGGQPEIHIANGLKVYMSAAPTDTIVRFVGDSDAGNIVYFDEDPGTTPLGTGLSINTADGTSGEIKIWDETGMAFSLVTTAGSWQMRSVLGASGLYMGKSVVVGGMILDNATDGFLYIPRTNSGPPTGTPTAQDPLSTGAAAIPVVVDKNNSAFYFYTTGWKGIPSLDQAWHLTSSLRVDSSVTATGGLQVGYGGGGTSAVAAGSGQDLYLGYGSGSGIIHLCKTNGTDALSVDYSGAAPKLGFFGTGAVVKPEVTGAKGSNVALGSLLTALAGLGLVIDSSTA